MRTTSLHETVSPDTARALRVCHIITGLPRGGAQTTLFNLLDRHDRTRFRMDVISLTEIGPVGEMIVSLGLKVRALNMNRKWPNPLDILKLSRWLLHDKPDIVQTWMYHSDLIGGFAARLARSKVIWNIRQSDLDPDKSKLATIWTARACALFSRIIPYRIVCCSRASRFVHSGLGYEHRRMLVIGNGIDMTVFRPDPQARMNVRRELQIDDATPLIGLVARFHPQKDHKTFVAAASEVLKYRPDAHFLLCGENISGTNNELTTSMTDAGIMPQCHLLGERNDIPKITAALDLSISTSSYAEGFSNVLIEAMACGVPCVATDVGDAKLILGDDSQIVGPGDPIALARIISGLLDLSNAQRHELGVQNRRRIEAEFQLSEVIDRYQNMYHEAVLVN